MRNVTTIITLLSLLPLLALDLALTACTVPAPDLGTTLQAVVAATQTPQPTPTPVPPTNTPVPPTATRTPTNTPVPPIATHTPTNTLPPPTNTPLPPTSTPTPAPPTDTPAPTDTPTQAKPVATPTPVMSAAEEHAEKGYNYFQQQQWDQAIAEFQEAVRLDPNQAFAYLGLGYSYALGPQDLPKAIQALEMYLQLEPNADNAADVRADVEAMRQSMADNPVAGIQIPEGKALFYFLNYTGQVWQVDVGPYFLEIPPRASDKVYNLGTIFIDPGTYTWSAHSLDNYYLVDDRGNRAFEITIGPGEAYGSGCCQ